jgi:hypothetical protein
MTLTAYSVVVRLDTTGQVSLVAGNGIAGFSGDGGPAALAELSGPTGVVDSAGNVYIEDAGNNRIRMVANGVITTVAGGGWSARIRRGQRAGHRRRTVIALRHCGRRRG